MSLLRVVALACVNAALLAAADSDIDVAIRGVLTRYLRFTTSDLADLQAGKVVRHGLDSTAAGEVGVVGAVRINAPKAKFLTHVRDIPDSRAAPTWCRSVDSAGRRRLDDLAALTVEAADFDSRSMPGWQLRRMAPRGGDSACRTGDRSGAGCAAAPPRSSNRCCLDDATAASTAVPVASNSTTMARPIRPRRVRWRAAELACA
jgi:hypothetical protein